MNGNTDSSLNFSINCRERFREYFLENTITSLFSIALNLGSCPVIILMNVLIIIAIKTRRGLQSEYNILLACLAGTNLAVGLVSQPLFIAQEIYFLSRASLLHYCYFSRLIVSVFLFYVLNPCLILAILSTERYIAMKYPLASWPTSRLIGAVICSWLISAISLLLFYATAFLAIYIIVFCHTKVCFVSRRHMNQIKTQRLPSITKAKFLVERKALKTTSIIVGFICAKHFAQGNRIYRSPTQAVTLGVDRFVM